MRTGVVAFMKISLGIVWGPGLFFVFIALLSSFIVRGSSSLVFSMVISIDLTIFFMFNNLDFL